MSFCELFASALPEAENDSLLVCPVAQADSDARHLGVVCGEGAVTGRCIECAEMVCAQCTKVHQKQKATKQHTVQPIEEYVSSGIPAAKAAAAAEKRTFCVTHPAPREMHELTLFCNTCNSAICMACTVKVCISAREPSRL